MKKRTQFLACAVAAVCCACGHVPPQQTGAPVPDAKWSNDIRVNSAVNGVSVSATVRVYFPREYARKPVRRVLIALHDQRGSARDWQANTDIARFADEYGFVVVCPSMSSTLYETTYFPETTGKWNVMPGGEWVATVLLPFVRESYGCGRKREYTGIIGTGMGARGAILVAASYPRLFGAAGGISGYYDNSVLTDNRAFISLYGPYSLFRDRWEKVDNPIVLAENLAETRVFLAHGLKDKEVFVDQTRLLGIKLKQLQRKSEGKYIFEYMEKAGQAHDWRLVRALTADMMSFFSRSLKN